jgi:hypothetical protein
MPSLCGWYYLALPRLVSSRKRTYHGKSLPQSWMVIQTKSFVVEEIRRPLEQSRTVSESGRVRQTFLLIAEPSLAARNAARNALRIESNQTTLLSRVYWTALHPLRSSSAGNRTKWVRLCRRQAYERICAVRADDAVPGVPRQATSEVKVGHMVGRRSGCARLPEHPAIHDVQTREDTHPDPEGFSCRRGILPRQITLAVRASLRFFQDLASAVRAGDAQVVIIVFGPIEAVFRVIGVVIVVPFFLQACPIRHRNAFLSRLVS